MKEKFLIKSSTARICLTAFLISLAVHLIFFIIFAFNGAILLDESMLLLNARYLADFGTDCMGEHLPIYFDTWLFGGQSPVATYLTALFIKIFGYSLAVTRIPIFLMSAIGLIAFYYFLINVFEEEKYIKVAFILACFSPWHIFNSIYTLDCNYMPHILIIGMAFLAKAIKSKKAVHFALAMIFFGLCFYCYIAAAFIIPLLLLIIYLSLLISKNISIKNAVISVLVITAVSLPFILSGLVQLGVIDEFKLFSLSISKMPYYTRDQTITYSGFLERLGGGILLTFFPDINMLGSIGMMNTFNYTNFIGGIGLMLGIVCLITSKGNKTSHDFSKARIFSFSALITFLIYVSATFYYTVLYRYFSFNYLFIVIEGIGFIYLTELIKKIDIKKFLAVFLLISTIIYCISYFSIFDKEYVRKNYWYINSFTQSVEYAKNRGYDSIAICFDRDEKLVSRGPRNAVALRLYDYRNKDNYYSIKDDLLMFLNTPKEIPLTKDNRFYYREVSADTELTDSCLIMTSAELEFADFDKDNYNIENFGDMVVVYK